MRKKGKRENVKNGKFGNGFYKLVSLSISFSFFSNKKVLTSLALALALCRNTHVDAESHQKGRERWPLFCISFSVFGLEGVPTFKSF